LRAQLGAHDPVGARTANLSQFPDFPVTMQHPDNFDALIHTINSEAELQL
jgi:hypothetical protein